MKEHLSVEQIAQLSGLSAGAIHRAVRRRELASTEPKDVKPWLEDIWQRRYKRSTKRQLLLDGFSPPGKADRTVSRRQKWVDKWLGRLPITERLDDGS